MKSSVPNAAPVFETEPVAEAVAGTAYEYAALAGDPDNTVDFQVHTGPALGAFNQWVKGTDLESWQNRHVDGIAHKLLNETEALLREKIKDFLR